LTTQALRDLDPPSRVEDDRGVPFQVEFRNVAGEAAAIGSAGAYTLVVDRPADGGGRGLGFNGGQLLYLAIGGCISNDVFREAATRGIRLTTVRVVVRGDFSGDPAVSDPVSYDVELSGDATREQLEELVAHVDAIAEIPNSVRRGTQVKIARVEVASSRP
jgi:putative redox protein